MKTADQTFEFRADLDVEGFSPTDSELQNIEAEIDRLKPLIRNFPTQILHVNLEYNRHSEAYDVKLALVLPGQTFATGHLGDAWPPCLETCVTKLIQRVEHYKSDLSGEKHRAHKAAGTTAEVQPTQQVNGRRVTQAIEENNYVEFRAAMDPLESSLRDRVGRWIQRSPALEQRLGSRFTIADIVEETFMMAFQQFDEWRPTLLFGQWIETLIDPAVKAIISDPDGELEAISFQRTWREAQNGHHGTA